MPNDSPGISAGRGRGGSGRYLWPVMMMHSTLDIPVPWSTAEQTVGWAACEGKGQPKPATVSQAAAMRVTKARPRHAGGSGLARCIRHSMAG
jgi:hypothetical protein